MIKKICDSSKYNIRGVQSKLDFQAMVSTMHTAGLIGPGAAAPKDKSAAVLERWVKLISKL